MSEKNLEQRVQELEQVQEKLGEGQEKLARGFNELKPYLDSKFEELGTRLVEHTNQPDEGEVEQLRAEIIQLRQSTAERFVSAFEKADLDEKDVFAQRMFDAIRAHGYDIVPKEQLAEATGEAETEEGKDGGTPEPPYLHIIDHPEEGYFPWTEGRFAKIVEAV